jgi:hypothetical protein
MLTMTFAELRKAGACKNRYTYLREKLPEVAACNAVTRRFLRGEATRGELEAAELKAFRAANEAAEAATRAAVSAATWEAARVAAEAAVSVSTTRSVAGAAAEREWQVNTLRELLEKEAE